MKKRSKGDILWDIGCAASLIGIWPRFIEPNLLKTTHLNLPIPKLSSDLNGFTILQFSDLHIDSRVSDFFLNKIRSRIRQLNPDCIVFTGDFLSCSVLDNPNRLIHFLSDLRAHYGSYAILGNHDYAQFVSVNDAGDYATIKKSSSLISKGFKRLFSQALPTGHIDPHSSLIENHETLLSSLEQTHFELLHNETKTIRIKDSLLNISGLGEYALGKTDPEKAFRKYQHGHPGIVLIHNPDAIPLLKNYPGEIILCGHTHGGQINLPWMWRKFTLMEHPEWKRGLKQWNNRWSYVNRGVGAVIPFRWFSVPELTMFTLTSP